MSRTLRMAGPIVVGVDGSAGSKAAAAWGARAADRHGTSLVLLHALAIPDFYLGAVPPTDELLRKVRTRGEAIVRETRAAGVDGPVVESTISEESAAPALIAASRTARMVVLGSTEHSRFTALFGGSVTTTLAGHAHSPVVSVRGHTWDLPITTGRPVVVGVDGSPPGALAVEVAFDEACARGAELIAVHAWGDVGGARVIGDPAGDHDRSPAAESAQNLLTEQLASVRMRYPDVKVHQVVAREEPRQELLRWSTKAQLIVVGNRGRGGFRGLLLGSTGQALIHHAACPVLIARTAKP